jgi:hypothetical protein
MTNDLRNAKNLLIAKRATRTFSLGVLFGMCWTTCAIPANALPATTMPALHGEALQRTNAMIASNAALAPDNQIPTIFKNVVSLDDLDVVAAARAQSLAAGHDNLHYNYYLFLAALDKVRSTRADKLDIPKNTYHIYEPQSLKNNTGIVDLVNVPRQHLWHRIGVVI